MSLFRWLAIIVAILALTGVANAEVYQYFDEEGTLVVTDNPYGLKKPKSPHRHSFVSVQPAYRNDVYYEYYDVPANTFTAAVDYVKANGPFDPKDGKRYAAQTKWKLGWRYRYETSTKTEGENVYVTVNILDIEFLPDITVLLPELSPSIRLDERDTAMWERFLQALMEHEHDHVKITLDPVVRADAVRKISEIRSFTFRTDPSADIPTLVKESVESDTARIGHDLIMKIKDRNEEYDRVTDHGMKPEMRASFFGG